MGQLVALRGKGYDFVRDLWLRAKLSPSVLEILAGADAFRSLGLDRREALWAVRGLNRAGDKDDLPLLKNLSWRALEADARLPPMPLGEHVVEDYRHLSLSLKAHPVAFLRQRLAQKKILRSEELAKLRNGVRATVAGLVLVRQRPGSANGVIFLTVEDETGIANIIVWPKIFEALRSVVLGASFLAASGRVQIEAGVIHIVMERAEDLTPLLSLLSGHNGEISGREIWARRSRLSPAPTRSGIRTRATPARRGKRFSRASSPPKSRRPKPRKSGAFCRKAAIFIEPSRRFDGPICSSGQSRDKASNAPLQFNEERARPCEGFSDLHEQPSSD